MEISKLVSDMDREPTPYLPPLLVETQRKKKSRISTRASGTTIKRTALANKPMLTWVSITVTGSTASVKEKEL